MNTYTYVEDMIYSHKIYIEFIFTLTSRLVKWWAGGQTNWLWINEYNVDKKLINYNLAPILITF